jgi:hypothetical protein
MGVMICEKARGGIEVKTMRLFDDQEAAEAVVQKTYHGKWFIYAITEKQSPKLLVTYDFRHHPVGKPVIKRSKA